MPNYLAQYTIKAAMCDAGAFMPDPNAHKREYNFVASDDDSAIKEAEKHKAALAKEFFGPLITLDKLIEVRKVPLD